MITNDVPVSPINDQEKTILDEAAIQTRLKELGAEIKAAYKGRDVDVLLIDNILDTGNTLSNVSEVLESMKPASLKTCVLLDKKVSRSIDFKADFVGFKVPDEFTVGYSLDFAERYRQLPCIGVLKAELQHT